MSEADWRTLIEQMLDEIESEIGSDAECQELRIIMRSNTEWIVAEFRGVTGRSTVDMVTVRRFKRRAPL